LLQKLADHNRESWFNDKTFLGLYGEKEAEYQSGKVTPFLDEALFEKLHALVKNKKVWEISESIIQTAEDTMKDYGRKRMSKA
jgi:hypothetical protein